MSMMSRKEFAQFCNCSDATVSVYLSRGHLLQDKLHRIDPEHQKSKRFYKNRIKIDKKKNKNFDVEVTSEVTEWKQRKIIADSKKAQFDADLRKVQLEKAMGKVIPVEVLNRILKFNIQGAFVMFHQESQNLASVYADVLAGGDRKKLAELNDAINVQMEQIIGAASEDIYKNVNKAIEDFQ